jgi:hypothetical protein
MHDALNSAEIFNEWWLILLDQCRCFRAVQGISGWDSREAGMFRTPELWRLHRANKSLQVTAL